MIAGFAFGEADGREFGVDEGGSRDGGAVCSRALALTNQLVKDDALVVQGDVGELGATVDVTDGKNVFNAGAQVLVDVNSAALGELEASVFESQIFSGCLATSCYQDCFSGNFGLFAAFCVFRDNGCDAVLILDFNHVSVIDEADALLLQDFGADSGDVLIGKTEDACLVVEDGDVCAKTGVDASEF